MNSIFEISGVLSIMAVATAIVGYTYSIILTEPKMVFHNLWKWTEKNLPEWLFEPFINCPYCVTGQLALWYYFFSRLTIDFAQNTVIHIFKYKVIYPYAITFESYNPVHHIVYICLAIFCIEIILTTKTKLDK